MSSRLRKDWRNKMEYKEALAYLDGARWFGAEPSLRRIRELLEALGDPQKKLKFIHIAGTNGKGSCAAMLSSGKPSLTLSRVAG